MNTDVLDQLKALQKNRGDLHSFSSYEDFLVWSDSVAPLLAFNEEFYAKFEFWTDKVKSAHRRGRSNSDGIGEAVGIVNQTIVHLELGLTQGTRTQETNELEFPQKVTVQWLIQHAPVSLWLYLIGLLFTAFILGVSFTKTPFYADQTSEQRSANLDRANGT
ncbi:MAG: hypothetical protein AAF597_19785 [Bacteroidota bacterium]